MPERWTWLKRVGVVYLVVALVGGEWWVVQTVAWSRMVVAYTASYGVREGVTRTFDGDHPCSLCLAVDAQTKPAHRDALVPTHGGWTLRGVPPDVAQLTWADPGYSRDPDGGCAVPSLERMPPPTPPPRWSNRA